MGKEPQFSLLQRAFQWVTFFGSLVVHHTRLHQAAAGCSDGQQTTRKNHYTQSLFHNVIHIKDVFYPQFMTPGTLNYLV